MTFSGGFARALPALLLAAFLTAPPSGSASAQPRTAVSEVCSTASGSGG